MQLLKLDCVVVSTGPSVGCRGGGDGLGSSRGDIKAQSNIQQECDITVD